TLDFIDEDIPPYGAPPPPIPYPYYSNAPPPPTFDDRMMTRSPDPINMYPPPYISRPNTPGHNISRPNTPGYNISRPNTPGYNQRVPSPAAGQRPPHHNW